MNTIKIVARQKIVNPSTNKIHNDEGLMALDGYAEEYIEVSDEFDANNLIDDFLSKNPNFVGCSIQIESIN